MIPMKIRIESTAVVKTPAESVIVILELKAT